MVFHLPNNLSTKTTRQTATNKEENQTWINRTILHPYSISKLTDFRNSWKYLIYKLIGNIFCVATACNLKPANKQSCLPGTLQSSKMSSDVLDPRIPSLSSFSPGRKPSIPWSKIVRYNLHTHVKQYWLIFLFKWNQIK